MYSTRIQYIRAFYQNTFLKMMILRRTLSNLFKLNLNSIHLDFPRDLFNFIYDFLFCWTHFRKLNLVMHLEIQLDCKLGPTYCSICMYIVQYSSDFIEYSRVTVQ